MEPQTTIAVDQRQGSRVRLDHGVRFEVLGVGRLSPERPADRTEDRDDQLLDEERRLLRNHRVAVLGDGDRNLGQSRHPLAVRFPVAGQSEEGADHVDETIAGRDFDQDTGLLIPDLPPVVNDPGLDLGLFPRGEDPFLAVDLEADATREDVETLTWDRVVVGDRDSSPRLHVKVDNEDTLGIVERIGKHDRPLARDRIIEYLTVTGHESILSQRRRGFNSTPVLTPQGGGKIPNVDAEKSKQAHRFARRYGETWEAWDTDGFLELFSEAVTYVAHPDEIVEGKDALKRYFEKEQEAQGEVRVRMGKPLLDGDRLMAEFWVIAEEDASIAGCLIAKLDPRGVCTSFREYWFDLEGRREPFESWGS